MSNFTREVVTLQVGHYSNFIGAHWWNIQNSSFVYHSSQISGPKEVNNDVLYRQGQNHLGEVTYTPRLIAFDLKGSLGTLKQTDTLYDITDAEEDFNWASDVTLHKAEAAPKNAYLRDLERHEVAATKSKKLVDENDFLNESKEQDVSSNEDAGARVGAKVTTSGGKLYHLDDSVKVWSDYLCPHLHPRSVHIIDAYQHDMEVDSFDLFSYGAEVYASERYRHEIEDRLHFFTEECDNIQGFQLFVDPFNGFGGLASSVLEDIADDFSNKGIMIFASTPSVIPNSSLQQNFHRIVNTALTYVRMIGSNSLLLPMSTSSKLWQLTGDGSPISFPHVHYRANLPYHTSAILASAVDCLSLPYRHVNGSSLLTHLTSALTLGGRKVAGLEMIFPFPMAESVSFVQTLTEMRTSLPLVSLTSSCLPGISPDAVSAVVRGISHQQLFSDEHNAFARSVDDVISEYFQQQFPSSLRAVFSAHNPCRVVAPYPHFFNASINANGFVSSEKRPSDKGVESVPTLTVVSSSSSVGGHLEELLSQMARIDLRRLHRLVEGGLEADEFQETVNALKTHSQLYGGDEDMS